MAVTDPEVWQRLSPHLDRALDLSGAERTDFVEALREQDPELAGELAGLLASHDSATAEQFLERGPARPVGSSIAGGHSLGAYTLVAEIGHGGMGNVWLAERIDGRFQRKVAVKFLGLGLASRDGEERFRREGSLLARLTHPHIARLIDAGVTAGGQPYLVIEHVDGEPIDRYCDGLKLGIERRLELFFDVLAAVADAHAQLIVHRDLKPSNVLVTRDGQVKLLDFGIAKLVDDRGAAAEEPMLTRVGSFALTPGYAAPEQVTGAAISTATDVYALGVMLYELLSGRHPLDGPLRAPADIVRAVLETVPRHMSEVASAHKPASGSAEVAASRSTTPEKLASRLRGDLDTIVRKALKKDPAERYPSVAALADDLRRFLRHEPIGARPDSVAYRTRKFVRRNRLGVALGATALAAVVAGVAGTLYQARTARIERDYALRQLSRAEALNDLNRFLLSDAAPLGRPLAVSELLARAEQIARGQTAGSLESKADLLVSIGSQYSILDESGRAHSVLEAAYAIAHATNDRALRARSACALAVTLAKTVGVQQSKSLIDEGLGELPDDDRFILDRIDCLQKASFVARQEGATSVAIARIEEARNLHARSPLRSEIRGLSIQMDVAESYSQAGRHAEALPAFEKAAAAMTSLGRGHTQSAGTLYNNWALSLDLVGRPREAEAIFRRAIDLSRADDRDKAVSPMLLLNYGRSLRALGRLDDAARSARAGYEKGKQRGFDVVVYQALLQLAGIYREQGDGARSAAALEELEPLLRRALPPGHLAFGSLMLQQALTAQATGRLPDALELVDRAYAIADASSRGGGPADFVPRVLVGRSELRHAAGRFAEAAADARLALEQFARVAPRGMATTHLGDAHLALGRALAAQGKADEAGIELQEALRHYEGALGSEQARAIAVRELLAQAE
jgi:serine/threonine-protein kinase